MSTRVPVNLISGFLGVGKTTAMLHLLANKPAKEYWAVIVNEFGEVGIDGATLASSNDDAAQLQVSEVPGGCICCTTSPLLRVTLTKLLRQRRPDRLLIEPSGLGHPAGIIDLLRSPGLASALDVRAVVTLLDARHLDDSRYTSHETWRDQLQLADVVVLNKRDQADHAQLQRAHELLALSFPPKLACCEATHGQFDAALLDLELHPERWPKLSASAAPTPHLLQPRRNKATIEPASDEAPVWPLRKAHSSLDSHSCGWIFPPEQAFFSARLAQLFEDLATPELGLAGLTRAKGVFHTERDWYRFDWVDGYPGVNTSAYRRDSRIELIVQADQAPDWQAVEQRLLDCQLKSQ